LPQTKIDSKNKKERQMQQYITFYFEKISANIDQCKSTPKHTADANDESKSSTDDEPRSGHISSKYISSKHTTDNEPRRITDKEFHLNSFSIKNLKQIIKSGEFFTKIKIWAIEMSLGYNPNKEEKKNYLCGADKGFLEKLEHMSCLLGVFEYKKMTSSRQPLSVGDITKIKYKIYVDLNQFDRDCDAFTCGRCADIYAPTKKTIDSRIYIHFGMISFKSKSGIWRKFEIKLYRDHIRLCRDF